MNIISSFLLITSYTSVVYTQNLRNGDYCLNERSGRPGTCIPLDDCPNARDFINIPCGRESKPLICCVAESRATPLTSNQRKRISETKCSEYQSAVYYQATHLALPLSLGSKSRTVLLDGCGSKDTKLISGGYDAGAREFPHMALIGMNAGSNVQPVWVCGGTLISDQFVLTAAHCFAKNINIIRLGELDYDRSDDEASPEDYTIIEKKLYPHYEHSTTTNDIGLLKVDRKVEFNIYRRPACLSSSTTVTGEKALATGWGDTSYSRNSKLSRLQKVVLDIFDLSNCDGSITNNQICAGSETDNRDTCPGDSGGPLQVFHETEYCMFTIIGISSFGPVCGFETPGVYTRVYPFIEWIEKNVWGN